MPGFAHPLTTRSTYRVLYLGDDLEFIRRFREQVSEDDCRLVACDEGSIILFLRDIHYDLMFIDHNWRGREGLKLARLARSQHDRKRMPIVLLSATKLDHKTEALAQKAGVIECALKSADMSELLGRVIVHE